jgi:hypothetical protein
MSFIFENVYTFRRKNRTCVPLITIKNVEENLEQFSLIDLGK